MQSNSQSSSTTDPIRSEPLPTSNVQSKSDDLPPPYTSLAETSKPSENIVHPPLSGGAAPTIINASPSYKWPRHSITIKCPSCEATVKTQVETSSTAITVLISLVLLLLCFILACIPFCIPACKRTIHYCPNCGFMLGKRKEFC